MKKTSLGILVIALLSLLIAPSVHAQLPTDRIETLIVDLWPDYDQPSVLVLLTGTLPADTPLPATVTIPLSDNAQLNAVARITSDDRMLDDLVHTTENNMLTFTTPDPKFRVEYYAPYTNSGNNHAFSFDWLADLRVDNVVAAVQQPSSATNMNVTPENANIVTDSEDGFTYFTFPPQPIPAGAPFTITFNYDMTNPTTLSVDNMPVPNPVSNTNTNPSPPPTASSSSNSFALDNINWALVLGFLGLILTAVFITWQVATRKTQPASKSRKPHPKRAAAAPKSPGNGRFCHQCGNSLTAQDKFCRKCGTAVKGS